MLITAQGESIVSSDNLKDARTRSEQEKAEWTTSESALSASLEW